jgi:hypothetical protein
MTRRVNYLRLYREPMEVQPKVGRDVGDIVLVGILGFLIVLIAREVMK